MEKFISVIQELQKEIDGQKESKSILINNVVIQKQYLAYYIYRIICHHFDFFKSIAMVNGIKQINTKLGISSKHQYVCYPLANRMTTDSKELDEILTAMTSFLTASAKKLEELKRPDEPIEKYLEAKTQDTIIKDIKELIKFVPNLSKFQYY